MPTNKSKDKKATKLLNIEIENLASVNAPVYVSIYGTDNKFLSLKDQLKVFRFIPTGTRLTEQPVSYTHLMLPTNREV